MISVCRMSAQNVESDKRFENYRQLWKREKNIENFKSKLKTSLIWVDHHSIHKEQMSPKKGFLCCFDLKLKEDDEDSFSDLQHDRLLANMREVAEFFTKHRSRWSSNYLRTKYPILCYYSLNKNHVKQGKYEN